MAIRLRVEKISPDKRCRLQKVGGVAVANELLQRKNSCWSIHVADVCFKEVASGRLNSKLFLVSGEGVVIVNRFKVLALDRERR